MLILVDENIPYAREAFGSLGEVRRVAGRAMTSDTVCEADVLLVRSVTRVHAALLAGSRVKFVGTATIGTDHIDLEYLRQHEIAFASAAGCNANSVAEYIVAALLHVAVQRELRLEGLTLGIVGVGNVGSRVAEKARALGLKILLHDPPLQELLAASPRAALTPMVQENLARLMTPAFHSMEELRTADFITLHTPLVRGGQHPTFHLFDEERLRQMKPGSILLNTARGEVVDNLALKHALRARHLAAAVLDVWEHEPYPDPELLQETALATPHIAGYSFDGKVRGTWLVYEALCRFLQVAPQWDYASVLPALAQAEIALPKSVAPRERWLYEIVQQAYDLVADDAKLRSAMLQANWTREMRGKHFDQLRHEYPVRREFHNYYVSRAHGSEAVLATLHQLGFGLH